MEEGRHSCQFKELSGSQFLHLEIENRYYYKVVARIFINYAQHGAKGISNCWANSCYYHRFKNTVEKGNTNAPRYLVQGQWSRFGLRWAGRSAGLGLRKPRPSTTALGRPGNALLGRSPSDAVAGPRRSWPQLGIDQSSFGSDDGRRLWDFCLGDTGPGRERSSCFPVVWAGGRAQVPAGRILRVVPTQRVGSEVGPAWRYSQVHAERWGNWDPHPPTPSRPAPAKKKW